MATIHREHFVLLDAVEDIIITGRRDTKIYKVYEIISDAHKVYFLELTKNAIQLMSEDEFKTGQKEFSDKYLKGLKG